MAAGPDQLPAVPEAERVLVAVQVVPVAAAEALVAVLGGPQEAPVVEQAEPDRLRGAAEFDDFKITGWP